MFKFDNLLKQGWIELTDGDHVVTEGRYFTRESSASQIMQSGGIIHVFDVSAPVINLSDGEIHVFDSSVPVIHRWAERFRHLAPVFPTSFSWAVVFIRAATARRASISRAGRFALTTFTRSGRKGQIYGAAMLIKRSVHCSASGFRGPAGLTVALKQVKSELKEKLTMISIIANTTIAIASLFATNPLWLNPLWLVQCEMDFFPAAPAACFAPAQLHSND